MTALTSKPAADTASVPDAPTCFELFHNFAIVGLTGFGGVLPWARRMIVERRGWLSDLEFAELLPLAQLLPGPNVANIATLLGRRYRGFICSPPSSPFCWAMPISAGAIPPSCIAC